MSKVCVECGHKVADSEQLYHEKLFKKTKILKLLQCDKCDAICDKYLEYEGTLKLLDASLQNLAAFRHLLINENNSSTILKVTLVTLIIDAYCRWSDNKEMSQFFEQEFEFYTKFGEAVTSLAVYLVITLVIVINTSNVTTSVPGWSWV